MNVVFILPTINANPQKSETSYIAVSLPKILSELGYDVSIITPLYGDIETKYSSKKPIDSFEVNLENEKIKCQLSRVDVSEKLKILFVENDKFFRDFKSENVEVEDDINFARQTLFDKAAFYIIKENTLIIDVLHLIGWQSALIPAFLKLAGNEKLNSIPCIYTISPMAGQGVFSKDLFGYTGLPESASGNTGFDYYGKINFLKGAIIFSDVVSTISEKYARELQKPESSFGLDDAFAMKAGKIYGILNDSDYKSDDPATDINIAQKYILLYKSLIK